MAPNDYEAFKAEVKKMSTIDLNLYKERQMKRRIDSLISKNGFKGYDDYVEALKKDKKLYGDFINYLTINVSEFWRNPEQWKNLENDILPTLFSKFGKPLKIWSAACSTGDEPYSLVMLLSKYMPLSQIRILATDLDTTVMNTAKVGMYNEKSLKGLPKEYLDKYFKKVTDQTYQISDDIKKCVTFKQHNLLKDKYPDNLDLIVCRNVVIYFTEEAKEQVFINFNKSLKRDGVLFIGSTEQIIQSQKIGFKPQHSFFYIKTN